MWHELTHRKSVLSSLDQNRKYLSVWQNNLKSAMGDKPDIPAKVVIYPFQWAD